MAPTAQTVPDCFVVTRNASGSAISFHCKICNSTLKRWRDHYNGSQHKKKASQHEERSEANRRVEQAYQDAVAAPLNALADVQMDDPRPAFDAELSGLADVPHGVEVSLSEAQAMLDAAGTETGDQYQARVHEAMTELITRAGWMQLDAEDEADPDEIILPDDVDDTELVEDLELLSAALGPNAPGSWFPYPRKTWTILHLLRIVPRMRLSVSQFKLVLWAMRECGCRDVPSFYALRKLQDRLRNAIGASTVQHTSELGNVFYSNDIRETISMELRNPQVAEHLVFYPELESPAISEVWQATRWTELPPDLLTPMIRIGAHDFFVGELAQLASGQFVVPCMWFTRGSVLFGCCLSCAYDSGTNRVVVGLDDERIDVPESEFARTFIDLVQTGDIPGFLGERSIRLRSAMPNRLREEAAGDMLYSVILNVWADDVSGNVSKQYNKHINVCVSNMCLPAALLQQEYFVRFFSTSPSASSAEQLAALKQQVMATHETPFASFNARIGRPCKFRLIVQALPGDNPQQSDNCSHLGLKANLNCRRCFNSTQIPEELNNNFDWYINNFSTGTPRTKDETLEAVKEQLRLACSGVADRVANKQTETGVKDPIAESWVNRLISKARELKAAAQKRPDDPSIPHTEEEVAEHLRKWLEAQPGEHWHPLLQWSGLDAHRDTPVELLHTILLGIAKYVWYDLHSDFTTEEQALFVTRLQSSDVVGLSLPALRASYIMQYRNNLIGRHFKALLQLQVFHTQDICSRERFTLIKATGALAAFLWFTEIKVMEEYLADLRILIANVLDAYTAIDPTRILVKAKLHVLPHLPDDIRRFGPAVRSATEIFECFNAIFRICSVLSNHQSPSRDIAASLADMDCAKHIFSGGFWWDDETKQFVQASENVRSILHDHPIVQRHLGWAPPTVYEPGAVTLPARSKRTSYTLTPSEIANLARDYPFLAADVTGAEYIVDGWLEGVDVVSASGDKCPRRAWVMCGDSPENTRLARIDRILVAGRQSRLPTLVILRDYIIASERHPHFDMPFATCTEPNVSVVPPSAIRFIVNVQHDCRTAKCGATGTQPVLQERVATSRTIPTVEHTAEERWVINTHAFHNASLLREALPRAITEPIPLNANRNEWLAGRAQVAYEDTVQKRRTAQKKAAETRAKNKALRAAAEAAEGDAESSATGSRPRKRRRG